MHETENAATAGKGERGHMFLIDIPTFGKICDLGDADLAAVYLIMAAGTGADNRTSTWSREAINKRTGLNWRKAAAAIDKLEHHGFVRWLSGKGTRKPRLDLPPIETRLPMRKYVAALADCIMHGEQPGTPKDMASAALGKDQGWFAQDEDGTWQFIATRPMVKAYLPNALVGDETGKATGSSTIVDRIRLSRDALAFRLLVDLYALQDLAEHGGVNRWSYNKKFKRDCVHGTGQFRLWQYTDGKPWARMQTKELVHHWHDKEEVEQPFFVRAQILRDAGALEWVYYLAEDGDDNSNHIYPVAVERYGKVVWDELESIIGGYATRAACALADTGDAEEREMGMPAAFFLPAESMARQATLVGVPRLRCRAKTTNTARWRREMLEDAEGIIQMFRGIIAEHAPELLTEADRRLADFNGASTKTSTLIQRDINDPFKSSNNTSRASHESISEACVTQSADEVAELIGRTAAKLAVGERFQADGR